MGEGYSELGQYILMLCETQNLSLRQASRRSGLEDGTISKILRRDGRSTPTTETLDKIAEGLNGDYIHMLSLAGHLPPTTGDADDMDAELYTKMQRLQDLIRQAGEKDPAAAKRLMGYFITSFEVVVALKEIEEGAQETVVETASDGKTV